MHAWLVVLLQLPLAAVLAWIYQSRLPAPASPLRRWLAPLLSLIAAFFAAESGFRWAQGGGQLWPHILAALCAFGSLCAAFVIGWWSTRN